MRSNHTIKKPSLVLLSALLIAAAHVPARCQVNPAVPSRATVSEKHDDSQPAPLPDIPALMRQVEINQRLAETVEKTYIYHSVETRRELESKGREKITVVESDHFWLNGVPVRRVVRKDGKNLSAEELAKEDSRIDKEAKEARQRRDKMEANGKESDPEGHEEITVSRLLELGAFTNPRRVALNGRDTIVVDYAGDPHAKTRNRDEDVIRDMAGTAWVDEQDKVLVRADGRFVRPFKVGAGLLVNIRQDTSFTFQQKKVNDEVWLPARIEAQGAARALLFFAFSGNIEIVDSDYRKFRTSTTILPGTTVVPDSSPVSPDASPVSPLPPTPRTPAEDKPE